MQNQQIETEFIQIGKKFEKEFLYGFRLRKPKKTIQFIKYVLRTYRADTDVFVTLVGIMMVWRHIFFSSLNTRSSRRELKRVKQSVIRSFNYALHRLGEKDARMLVYLIGQTKPSSSAVNYKGDPLRELLMLKARELVIKYGDKISGGAEGDLLYLLGSESSQEQLESAWKSSMNELNEEYCMQMPFLFT